MKKYLIILLVLAFTASILYVGIGCKEPEVVIETVIETVVETVEVPVEEDAGPATIVFQNWTSAEEASAQFVLDAEARFMELNPDVIVEDLGVPWSQHVPLLITSTSAGNPPDIMAFWASDPFLLASMGALLDLNTFGDEEFKSDFFDSAIEAGTTVDGAWVTAPSALVPYGLWTNKDLLNQAGVAEVPETIDELMAACEKIKQTFGDDVWPIGLEMSPLGGLFDPYAAFMLSFGAEPFKDGTPNIDTPEMKDFAEWYREMIAKKYTPLGLTTVEYREFMAKEQMVFYVDHTYFPTLAPTLNPKFEGEAFAETFSIIPIPYSENISGAVCWTANASLAISAQTKYPEEAFEFIKFWIASDDIMTIYRMNMGELPAVKSANDPVKYEDYFSQKAMPEFVNDILPVGKSPNYFGKFSSAAQFLVSGLQEVIYSDKPIDEILATIESNVAIAMQ